MAIEAESAPNSLSFTLRLAKENFPFTFGELRLPRTFPLKASWPAIPMPYSRICSERSDSKPEEMSTLCSSVASEEAKSTCRSESFWNENRPVAFNRVAGVCKLTC